MPGLLSEASCRINSMSAPQCITRAAISIRGQRAFTNSLGRCQVEPGAEAAQDRPAPDEKSGLYLLCRPHFPPRGFESVAAQGRAQTRFQCARSTVAGSQKDSGWSNVETLVLVHVSSFPAIPFRASSSAWRWPVATGRVRHRFPRGTRGSYSDRSRTSYWIRAHAAHCSFSLA